MIDTHLCSVSCRDDLSVLDEQTTSHRSSHHTYTNQSSSKALFHLGYELQLFEITKKNISNGKTLTFLTCLNTEVLEHKDFTGPREREPPVGKRHKILVRFFSTIFGTPIIYSYLTRGPGHDLLEVHNRVV